MGFGIIYKKGYQDVDTAVSALTTKVKGVGYFCRNENFNYKNCSIAEIDVWDTTVGLPHFPYLIHPRAPR